jgi:hypothetical protein
LDLKPGQNFNKTRFKPEPDRSRSRASERKKIENRLFRANFWGLSRKMSRARLNPDIFWRVEIAFPPTVLILSVSKGFFPPRSASVPSSSVNLYVRISTLLRCVFCVQSQYSQLGVSVKTDKWTSKFSAQMRNRLLNLLRSRSSTLSDLPLAITFYLTLYQTRPRCTSRMEITYASRPEGSFMYGGGLAYGYNERSWRQCTMSNHFRMCVVALHGRSR